MINDDELDKESGYREDVSAAAPAAPAEDTGAWPEPNDRHLARLRESPDTANFFDAKFRPGASERALGVGQSETARRLRGSGAVGEQTADWCGKKTAGEGGLWLGAPVNLFLNYHEALCVISVFQRKMAREWSPVAGNASGHFSSSWQLRQWNLCCRLSGRLRRQ